MSRQRRIQRNTIRLALAGIGIVAALAGALAGCSHAPDETGTGGQPSSRPGVGSPCMPPDEYEQGFSGSRISEESIVVSDYADCGTGICLVNHFQGRVSCPFGQPAPAACSGPSDPSCGAGSSCVPASAPGTFVCSTGTCQIPSASDSENIGKACCVPGTTTPVETSVCGQCDAQSRRNADNAVYCSCRCAPAEGAPPEPGATFCSCPTGFMCTEIRPWFGVGDPSNAGSYCIREGTAYTSAAVCGQVKGQFDPATCAGIGTP